jgi:hypothetical protein
MDKDEFGSPIVDNEQTHINKRNRKKRGNSYGLENITDQKKCHGWIKPATNLKKKKN